MNRYLSPRPAVINGNMVFPGSYYENDTEVVSNLSSNSGVFNTEADKENPFNTKHGQDVVSVNETFWARLARHGRYITTGSALDRVAISDNSGNLVFAGPSVQVEPGFIFYPKSIVLSADIDCELVVKIITGQTPSGITPQVTQHFFSAYLKAGTPLTLNFEGEIACEDTASGTTPGVFLGSRTTTAGGYMYFNISGVEVAKYA